MVSKPAPLGTVPIPGTRWYHGEPCQKCGSTIRMLSNRMCSPCQNRRNKNWVEKRKKSDPIAARRHALKYNYNLTLVQFDDLLASQSWACAICKRTEPGKRGWVVDHCHRRGNTRGILCNSCNSAIGLFKDDLETMRNAIDYLSGDTQPARMFFAREMSVLDELKERK